jgi:hypothetical protein
MQEFDAAARFLFQSLSEVRHRHLGQLLLRVDFNGVSVWV